MFRGRQERYAGFGNQHGKRSGPDRKIAGRRQREEIREVLQEMTASKSRYDLHLHSHWSYDTSEPLESFFRAAFNSGLSCIAITDHNNWDCIGEATVLADRYPSVRFVAGSELYVTTSTLAPDFWLHLLCYNLPAEPSGGLKAIRDWYRHHMRQLGDGLTAAIAQVLSVSSEQAQRAARACRPENVVETQGVTGVGMPPLRHGLNAAGIDCSENQRREVLRAMWKTVSPVIPTAKELVPRLKSSGVLTVLAHPHFLPHGNETETLGALADELQLDGIECAHPEVPPELGRKLQRYCAENRLFMTAGSDSHSCGSLGDHEGQEEWLAPFLERITVT